MDRHRLCERIDEPHLDFVAAPDADERARSHATKSQYRMGRLVGPVGPRLAHLGTQHGESVRGLGAQARGKGGRTSSAWGTDQEVASGQHGQKLADDSRDIMSLSSWLVAGIVPGVERQPLTKLAVDEIALLKLLHRWQEEAEKAGHIIKRTAVAFEAGRDGFWLARWLRARDFEVHVIHASSVAVSREHRRAKTDRLDTELLKRAFLGWLRGERDHCKMVAIPTIRDEDGKRPNRERESLVGEQSRIINRIKATLARLGIRGFNPKLRKAAERLEGLRTPEGEPIPPNTLSELHREMGSAGNSCAIRFSRSRAHAWIASSMHLARWRTPWSACWRV
jgi:hypothetical protein